MPQAWNGHQSKAMAPEMCGVAIDVPLAVVYEVIAGVSSRARVRAWSSDIGFDAVTSISCHRSAAAESSNCISARVQCANCISCPIDHGGSDTVEQAEPELPAATTIWMPAAP